MSVPTIALATNNGNIGGGEVMLLNIAGALRVLGLAVTVLAPMSPGELLREAEVRGFQTVALRAASRVEYMAALAQWRLGHRDIPLWCNGLVPTLATTGMGPRIAHLHILPTGLHAMAAWIGRFGAAEVLVPSRFMAARIRGSRVLENWTPDITYRARSPRPEGPLRVGFLGRLTRDKGVHVLARAMQHVIAQSDREVRLVLAGENRFGDPEDDREIQAALEPLAGAVDQLGWVPREEFFDQVDLAVFPSVAEESFGLVAAEAMAAGIPFILSDAGALPEVVGEAYPWTVQRDDPDALANAILSLTETIGNGDEAVRAAMRRRWEALFSPAAGTLRAAELLDALPRPTNTTLRGSRGGS